MHSLNFELRLKTPLMENGGSEEGHCWVFGPAQGCRLASDWHDMHDCVQGWLTHEIIGRHLSLLDWQCNRNTFNRR